MLVFKSVSSTATHFVDIRISHSSMRTNLSTNSAVGHEFDAIKSMMSSHLIWCVQLWPYYMINQESGLILHRGNEVDCLHAHWSLHWCT